jgi:hypothetical protein
VFEQYGPDQKSCGKGSCPSAPNQRPVSDSLLNEGGMPKPRSMSGAGTLRGNRALEPPALVTSSATSATGRMREDATDHDRDAEHKHDHPWNRKHQRKCHREPQHDEHETERNRGSVFEQMFHALYDVTYGHLTGNNSKRCARPR